MSDPIKKITLRDGTVRYRFVVDVGRDADSRRKQLTVTMDTKKEAQDELARIRHQKRTGEFIMPGKIILSEWIRTWLEKKAEDLEPTTLRSYENMVIHIHEKIGHIRLQALTEEDAEAFVEWLLTGARRRGGKTGTGLRPSTAEGVLGRLKEALGRAAAKKLVHTNVAQYVKIPRQAKKRDKRANERPKPWNVTEVQTFINGILKDRLYAPLLLSLIGLRPAEVAEAAGHKGFGSAVTSAQEGVSRNVCGMEIWINPACSKCRSAIGLLDAEGADYTVRRYLEDVPTEDEIRDVLDRLGLEPWDITRTQEAVAKELGLKEWARDAGSRDRWIAALSEHPKLIQRPIITADDGTAVVARTDEAVQDALSR